MSGPSLLTRPSDPEDPALYQEYTVSGAKTHGAPRNDPWALEMHVEDPDGHVLRFGSEPLADQPFESWAE